MLPFLKKKNEKSAPALMGMQKPDGDIEMDGGDEMHALQIPAEDLIAAIEAKDAKAVAEALQAAFDIADSMPHEEGPHLEEA